MEETRVPIENHRSVAAHWQTLSHIFVCMYIYIYNVWKTSQLPVESVSITTTVVSSNPAHARGVLDTTVCDKVCQWAATDRWFSLGTLVSSINKTYRQDITEIVLKVALNTKTYNLHIIRNIFFQGENFERTDVPTCIRFLSVLIVCSHILYVILC
jgi:hypothetical protein